MIEVNTNKGISGKTKVADLVNMNFHLLGVLSRLGIKPGFGEKSLSDVCAGKGLDEAALLVICKVYVFDDFIPSAEDLDPVKIEDIIRYLRLSHRYYMDSALVVLEEALSKMLAPCQDSRKKVIWKFFLDYKEELRRHFEYEEGTVFPYAEGLKDGSAERPGSIEDISDGHSSIEEKIDDLKNILMRYLPADCDASDIDGTLLYIFFLEKELQRHTAIEDKVLSPMINRLSGYGN